MGTAEDIRGGSGLGGEFDIGAAWRVMRRGRIAWAMIRKTQRQNSPSEQTVGS